MRAFTIKNKNNVMTLQELIDGTGYIVCKSAKERDRIVQHLIQRGWTYGNHHIDEGLAISLHFGRTFSVCTSPCEGYPVVSFAEFTDMAWTAGYLKPQQPETLEASDTPPLASDILLVDKFALEAYSGLVVLSTGPLGLDDYAQMATTAYEIAGCMMAARAKHLKTQQP